MGMYKAAARCTLGNGETARFWTDWWLRDGRIEDIMPHLYAMLKKSGRQITVKQALTNRCWTSNRLQRRQLPHPSACPFCDQAPETLDHLLLRCVLARQVWAKIMNTWVRPDWTSCADSNLVEWWTSLNPQKHFQKEAWTGCCGNTETTLSSMGIAIGGRRACKD